MGDLNVGKAVVGGLCLLLVGAAVVVPWYPADLLDVFWLVAVMVGGTYLVVEAGGSLSVRLQLLEWRTSRKGKLFEWGGGVIIAVIFVQDFGFGLPFFFLAGIALVYILGWKRYYRNLNEEKERLRQKAKTL